ncbi:excisionase family DNA binding protein [Kineococcus xinjiangensis]|uniref:Excisionase family DNA binding protein n=2 Tax=Kineococcus xinjiangensis TaxID=512762 RepID=A0A2S6ICP7_9ACTN|nr:excisionase family DNA binding protein [Kineococcus xinjiangensis]
MVGMTRHLDALFDCYGPHLTINDLMAILGVSRATAYKLVQHGEVPAYRVGSSWLILRDEVREHLAAGSNQTGGQPALGEGDSDPA